jgi:hypothetical protein
MKSLSRVTLASLTIALSACASVTVDGETEGGGDGDRQLPSSGGTISVITMGGAPGAGGGLIGGPSGGAPGNTGGGSPTGGSAATGGGSSGGGTSTGGAPSGCDCSVTWVSTQNIVPALTAGDCIGYMGTLYEYAPENATSTLQYADPACPPEMSCGDNC